MSDKENSHSIAESEQDDLSLPLPGASFTPPISFAPQPTSSSKQTPYANLRHLAGLIRRPSTPGHHKAKQLPEGRQSAGPSITPSSQARATPANTRALQPTSGNRSKPITPHAVRALQQRRNTPRFDRRRSGRAQRETPRDILRNLSKALVNESRPNERIPLQTLAENVANPKDDTLEDELSPDQPSLTLPIGQDDDSFDHPVPNMSMPLDDNDQTTSSLEVARRASVQQRLSRGGPDGALNNSPFMRSNFSAGKQNSRLVRRRGLGSAESDTDELSHEERSFLNRDETDDLRLLVQRNSSQQPRWSNASADMPNIDPTAYSPFVLQIPSFAPRESDDDNDFMADSLVNGDEHSTARQSIMAENSSLPWMHAGLDDEDPLHSERDPMPVKPVARVRRPQAVTSSKKRASYKISRFGTPFPAIPVGVTKTIANSFASAVTGRRSRMSKETLQAIQAAGEAFLAQLGLDLSLMARHAGRKTIEDSDVVTAMMRQRQVTRRATAFSLTDENLPRELVYQLRIPRAKISNIRGCRIPSAPGVELEDDIDVL